MKCIEILCYTHGTQDYARLLYSALIKLSDDPARLRFTWSRGPKKPDDSCWHNSYRHGLVLNELQAGCREPIGMLIDVDVCVLYSGWDTVLRGMLAECDAAGLSPSEMRRGSMLAPSVFLYAFNRGVNPVDFRPTLRGKEVESVARTTIAGKEVKCDTGWRIPYTPGLRFGVVPYAGHGVALPYTDADNRRVCCVHPSHMAEWSWDGKLFATHKQAARNHRLTGEFGAAWKARIDAYTRKEFGWVL